MRSELGSERMGRETSERARVLAPPHSRLLVERERLLTVLDVTAPVIVVQATAGWGKSALISSWAQRSKAQAAHVVWRDVGPVGESSQEFIEGLRDALDSLRTAGVTVDSNVRPIRNPSLSSAGTGPLPRLRPGSPRASRLERVVVIVENGDLLLDPRALQSLCDLAWANRGVQIIITSRIAHPIVAIAQDLGLEVELVTRSDLEATVDEIQQFAYSWGHDLTHSIAEELHRLSGGWPLLAQAILEERIDPDSPLSGDRATESAVLRVLHGINDAPLIELAKLLAVSDIVTVDQTLLVLAELADPPQSNDPDAIDAGVAMEQAISAIHRLEQTGLLERCRETGEVTIWRFERIVRCELVRRLTANHAETAIQVHRALSGYLASIDRRERCGEALRHAEKSRDYSALCWLYLNHGVELFADFPHEALAAFSAVPDDLFREFPVLALPVALARALATDPTDGERSVLLRASMWAGSRRFGGAADGSPIDEVTSLVITDMVTKRANGSLKDALELARRFGDHLAKRHTQGDPDPVPLQQAMFWVQWSETCMLAGDLARAAVLSRNAFEAASGNVSDLVASSAAAQLVLIQTLRGEPASAERWLSHHEYFGPSDRWIDSLVALPAEIAAVYVALDRLDPQAVTSAVAATGDATQAVEFWPFIAQALTQHALLYGEPFVMLARFAILAEAHPRSLAEDGVASRTIDRGTADLLLSLGELNRAHEHLSTVLTDGPWLCVPRARLAFMAGDFSDAKDIASAGAWHPDIDAIDRIELSLIHSQAQLASGSDDEAFRTFARAHELAVDAGTLRPYATMPTASLDRLLDLSGLELSVDDRASIALGRLVYPASGEFIRLSPREKVVLQSLRTGESVSAIAISLAVSVNTVKKQVVRLYSKLGVTDRASALSRAGMLGLFH